MSGYDPGRLVPRHQYENRQCDSREAVSRIIDAEEGASQSGERCAGGKANVLDPDCVARNAPAAPGAVPTNRRLEIAEAPPTVDCATTVVLIAAH